MSTTSQHEMLRKYCDTFTDSWNDLLDLWNQCSGKKMGEPELDKFFRELGEIIKTNDIKIHNLNVDSMKTYKGEAHV